MKALFMPAVYNEKISLGKEIIEKLPLKVGLAASVQFVGQLGMIKKEIESIKNESLLKKSINKENNKTIRNKKAIIAGQILGCNVKNAEKIANKVDAFLYIGDGDFHPLAIALKINKPVYQYNPLNKEFKKISEEEINKIKKNQKVSYVKFLHADNVGIIISTKPGQYYPIEKTNSLIKRLENKYKNKKFYTFICDNVDEREFENFNFIQALVNTACSRITGKNIVNVEEVK